MGPELNIPKIDVKENWGEDINNTKDNLVKEINDILDNNEKINDLGKMLDKKFLEWITPEVAQKIIKAIPENLQNDEDVKNVITVLNAKISIAGNDNKIQNTKLDSVDTTNFIVDLSQYKKDISGHSEQYGLTWLNWEIWQCLLLINWSNNFQNLKNNLEEISKILDGKTAKLEDLNKIENFLKNNHVDVESWTQTNIQPLLKWIHVFLSRIAPTLQANKQNQKDADKILDEHEQKIKAQKEKQNLERLQSQEKLINMATSFSELKDKIPNDLKNLSKLNKKDIQNIKDFINKLPVTTTFPDPKTEIFDLYIKMYQCQQTLDGKNLTHRDKDNFNEIFNEISKTYENENNKEISTYALWRWFGIVNETSLQNAAPEDWDGKDLSENDNFVQNVCRWRLFSPKQYITKFNEINKKRIENNVKQLKNFDIKSVFTKEELNKFSIENIQVTSDSASKMLLKYWDTVLGLDNLVSTLKLENKAKEQLKQNKWNTNFASDDELIQLINDNDEIKGKWLNDIFTEIENRKQLTSNTETVAPEQETSLENLILNSEDIKKYFSTKYLTKNALANFFNEVKNQNDLSDTQKELLRLMYTWLTEERRDEADNKAYEAVKELQSKLWFQNDKVDWKFGITTFNKLKEIFWMAIKHNEGYKQTEVKNKAIDVKGNINIDNYSKVFDIINDWIWERQITFKYNSKVSFLINNDTCTLKDWEKTYSLKKTNVEWEFQLDNNYLEFLPTWIYITKKNKNNVHVYRPNWDTFHGTLKNNEYLKWKLSYKWWGSFEWTFENWKEKCWIRKNSRWTTRLEYNGETNYYLDISKSWEITYSQRFNIWPVNPYTETTALKMRLDEQGDNINLDGGNRIIKINKETYKWIRTRKSNDYTYSLPEEWCKLVCEQMNELTNK